MDIWACQRSAPYLNCLLYTSDAADEIAEAHRLSPDGRYSSIARLKKVGYLGVPKVRTLFETIYLTGYRKAGVPEE